MARVLSLIRTSMKRASMLQVSGSISTKNAFVFELAYSHVFKNMKAGTRDPTLSDAQATGPQEARDPP